MTHKLLLADDSVTIQRVIELTFADEDFEVTVVGDGQLAIERLEADPPDIVLADVDMPKRDGYEVAAYVKSRPKLAHIPVVLLTGAFEPIDQARAAAVGSSDVLAKPFEPQMVINRVKQLLGKKSDQPEPASAPPPQRQGAPSKPAAGMAPQAPQLGEQPPAHRQGPPQPAQNVSLDAYFDKLDAAFSNLQTGSPATGQGDVDWPLMEPPAPEEPESPAPIQGWLRQPEPPPARPAAAEPPRQAEALSAPSAGPAPAQRAWGQPPAAATARPVPPPAPAPPPVIAKSADAVPSYAPSASPFDATQGAPSLSRGAGGEPVASSAPVAPKAPAAPATAERPAANPFGPLSAEKEEVAAGPAAPVISDAVIEEVVARVLQRLSDRVVLETVSEIVTQTAERLVQEEIERIKNGGQ